MMLLYVWNHTTEEDKDLVDGVMADTPSDLLVAVLNKACTSLLKRGLYRNYTGRETRVHGVRGKMLFSASLRHGTLQQGKSICVLDEFVEDIPLNQIIKSTLTLIQKSKNVESKQRTSSRLIRNKFRNVQEIRLSKKVFSSVKIHRNNRTYRIIIHICELLFFSLKPLSQTGQYEFIDFTKSQDRLAILYEKFLLNFYKSCILDI